MKRLSKIKIQILKSASRYPYVTDGTYQKEKQSLREHGYLASYSKLINEEFCIISGCYMITDKGKEAIS